MSMDNEHQPFIPIAELCPSVSTRHFVRGIVTIIWPYSSSTQTTSILLVEPDFRLRQHKGQVLVIFRGASALAVARSSITSGDELMIGIAGATWLETSLPLGTPGRAVDWELRYGKRLRLQKLNGGNDSTAIEIDQRAPSPEVEQSNRSPPRTPLNALNAELRSLGTKPEELDTWDSPAFLTHLKQLYNTSFVDQQLEHAEHWLENRPNKRTRFGRGDWEWRFADQSPSPSISVESDAIAKSLVHAIDGKDAAHDGSRCETNTDLSSSDKAMQGVHTDLGIYVASSNEYELRGISLEDQYTDGNAHSSTKQSLDRPSQSYLPRTLPDASMFEEGHMGTHAQGISTELSQAFQSSQISDIASQRQSDLELGSSETQNEQLIDQKICSNNLDVYPVRQRSESENHLTNNDITAQRAEGFHIETSDSVNESLIETSRSSPHSFRIETKGHVVQLDQTIEVQSISSNPPPVLEIQISKNDDEKLISGLPNCLDSRSKSRDRSYSEMPFTAITTSGKPDQEKPNSEHNMSQSIQDLTDISESRDRRPSGSVGNYELVETTDQQLHMHTDYVESNITLHEKDDQLSFRQSPSYSANAVNEEPELQLNGGTISGATGSGELQMTVDFIEAENGGTGTTIVTQEFSGAHLTATDTHLSRSFDLERDLEHMRRIEALEDAASEGNYSSMVELTPQSSYEVANETNQVYTSARNLASTSTRYVSLVDGAEAGIEDTQKEANEMLQDSMRHNSYLEHDTYSANKAGDCETSEIHNHSGVQEPENTSQQQHTIPLTPQLSGLQEYDSFSQNVMNISRNKPESESSSVQQLATPVATQTSDEFPRSALDAVKKGVDEEKKSAAILTQEISTQHIKAGISNPQALTEPTDKTFVYEKDQTQAKRQNPLPTSQVADEFDEMEPLVRPQIADTLQSTPQEVFKVGQRPANPNIKEVVKGLQKEMTDSVVDSNKLSSAVSKTNLSEPNGLHTPLSYYPSLISLQDFHGTMVDVIATVISSTKPVRAKGGPRDMHLSLHLLDKTSHPSSNSFTTAQVFRPFQSALPNAQSGDVVLLRNFKVQSQRRKMMLLSTESSAWAVFRPDEEVQIRGPPVEVGSEEESFVHDLFNWWANREGSARTRASVKAKQNEQNN